MFLKVEWSGLEVEFDTEYGENTVGEDKIPAQADGVCYELDGQSRQHDARVSQREQHVDSGTDGAKQHADSPGPDGVDGHLDIVISY